MEIDEGDVLFLGSECFGDAFLLLSAIEHRVGLKLQEMQWL